MWQVMTNILTSVYKFVMWDCRGLFSCWWLGEKLTCLLFDELDCACDDASFKNYAIIIRYGYIEWGRT